MYFSNMTEVCPHLLAGYTPAFFFYPVRFVQVAPSKILIQLGVFRDSLEAKIVAFS